MLPPLPSQPPPSPQAQMPGTVVVARFILWIDCAFAALFLCMVPMLLAQIELGPALEHHPGRAVAILSGFVGWAALLIFTTVGIARRRPWSRWTAIAAAAVMIAVPGTAIVLFQLEGMLQDDPASAAPFAAMLAWHSVLVVLLTRRSTIAWLGGTAPVEPLESFAPEGPLPEIVAVRTRRFVIWMLIALCVWFALADVAALIADELEIFPIRLITGLGGVAGSIIMFKQPMLRYDVRANVVRKPRFIGLGIREYPAPGTGGYLAIMNDRVAAVAPDGRVKYVPAKRLGAENADWTLLLRAVADRNRGTGPRAAARE